MNVDPNTLLRSLKVDTGRTVAIVSVVAVLFVLANWIPILTGEPALAPLLTSVAMVAFLVAMSHIMRRLLFPELDLQAVARKAMMEPIGAAVVFAGVCVVISVLILANTAMLR